MADEVVDLPGELSERDLVGVVHRYFWDESVAEVVGRDPEELARLALEHLRLAAVRPRGAEVVAVDRPVDGPAVLRVVTDDMPFLVDSVTAEVVCQKVGLDHVVHPVVLVRRDATGNLLQFCDSPRSDESVTESWIAVLLSRQVDDEAAHDLIAGLRTVLADVRRVHEDAARLHDRALDVAHSLEQQRGHGPDHEAASVGGDPWSVLFALSMLARYEPDRWYKHISVASSPEAVPIENLLNLAMSSVPRTLLQVFTQLRDQLAT